MSYEKKYVSDIIGETYKSWAICRPQFIATPTGSGKTSFVLHQLLEYCIESDRTIYYFVNRKVLKKQLENEIFRLPKINASNHIKIFTYQEVERKIIENGYQVLDRNIYPFFNINYKKNIAGNNCDYIIMDEVHYFLEDSFFNPATEVLFNSLGNLMRDFCVAFMSATIDRFRDFLMETFLYVLDPDDMYRPFAWTDHKGKLVNDYEVKRPRIEYEEPIRCPKDYKYLNIQIFDDIEILPDLISEVKNGKTIVFYNDKKKCQEFAKKLNNMDIISATWDDDYTDEIDFEIKARAINKDYKYYEDASEVVYSLIEDRKLPQSVNVLFTTAFIDNGVNLIDKDIKNIFIVADTEEEFIQMIGRKRIERDESVNLYIYKKSLANINKMINYYINMRKEYQDLMPYIRGYSEIDFFRISDIILKSVNRRRFLNRFLNIYKTTVYSSNIRVSYPIYKFSNCSIRHLEDYCVFLLSVKEGMEKDDNYLVRMQLKWLGKDDIEIAEIIDNLLKDKKELYRNELIEFISSHQGKISKKSFDELRKNAKSLFNRIVDDLGKGHPQYDELHEKTRRNNKEFNETDFDIIAELISLEGYKLETEMDGKSKLFEFVKK